MAVDFERLNVGEIYGRPELARLWGYQSYNALARGVITPRNSNKIVLFITKEKQSHLTQYQDFLDGTKLLIEGEKNHVSDARIIGASTSNDEIHLFYRNRHHEKFTYYGTVTLVGYEEKTESPSRFEFLLGSASVHGETTNRNASTQTALCRLCWNSKGWTYPTGEAAKLEAKGSFVARNGFGHEEWLMNVGWVIDGWHYGFLQPINSAFEKWQGQEIDVLLYTIAPDKRRFYVGRIDKLRVLTSAQADAAAKEYRARGWLKEMVQQVKDVGGKAKTLEAARKCHDVLNVRYLPESLQLFAQFRPADQYLNNLPGRYRVYQSRTFRAQGIRKRSKRRGANRLNDAALLPQVRKGSGAVVANPIEKIMQHEIYNHLQKQYTNVEAERDFVDIKVEGPKGVTLIELKSSASALAAIRAALGQILEYAFLHPEWRSSLFELVIVGQGLETQESKRYIEWLRHDFDLPIRYLSYQRGTPAFRL